MALVPDASTSISAEIAALHKGRGLRDPRLGRRVGPALRAALHITDPATEPQVRDRVVAAIRSAAQTLPSDLRTAFLLASALTTDAPTLSGRLAKAATALDRDPRTVRRRLAQANDAVAVVLERGSRPQPAMEDAWYIESLSSLVEINAPRVRTRATKVIVPTQGGATRVSERFSLPNAPSDLCGIAEPEISVNAGGKLLDVQRRGTVWSYDVELHEPMVVGVQQEIITEIGFPSMSLLAPVVIMVPIRPCRFFDITVDFGQPPITEAAWLVDGDYPTTLADSPAPSTRLEVPESGRLRAAFSGLRAGLAYGLRWTWPGPPS
ncbi:MAG TPA: hypothetical protein PKA37_15525 [Planctomycetota bacterium]|nr:hypothetical protein [Planctomycetota bacterium]